ncbi:hypothetical protein [Leucobacter chromiiresistens]|uniref:Uncharacterized protein n=1 Tax=Leucobacter chromiiresistens TaxID=1079994 RepID=A0A1H0XXF5_9MICO|nr:hypothetical protein [Leucobacter chromiiresistens]SDQ07491.1 hypothetical protein SAMN04488565_0288 [Leucobacter chromiiresistens]
MSARTCRGASRLLQFPAVGTDAPTIAGGGVFGALRFFSAAFVIATGLWAAAWLFSDPEGWHFAVAPYFVVNAAIVLALTWATHRVAARPHRIRYFTRATGLWIGYPQRMHRCIAALLLLNGLLLGIANAVYTWEFFVVAGRSVLDLPRLAWGVLAVIPLSAYGLAQLARHLRLPPGVHLEERGLTFASSSFERTPSWEEIAAIEAVEAGKPHLVIVESSGRRSSVRALELGSDPVTVAAILQFFLHRPQHRSALADPQQAIRCFLTHRHDPS